MRQYAYPPCTVTRSILASSGNPPPMVSQDSAATYHPGFDTPDADGLSSSLDGMLFRLPSSVLLRSAAFFHFELFHFHTKQKALFLSTKHDAVLVRL